MKNILQTIILLAASVSFACCNEAPDNPALPAPELLSTVPENNAENIPVSDLTVTLTFNQNVICPSAEQKKVSVSGGATISKIVYDSSKPTISILINNLDYETNYTLTIPANVIKNPSEVGAKAISLTFTTQKEPKFSETLCTDNPSPEAVALYNYLKSIYGKKTLSGAMASVAWNIDEAERVYRWTGKYPAINTFDYIHLWASPANWIDYGNISVVENWRNEGGIVGAMWHWNVPKYEGAPRNVDSNNTFRTEETTFRTANATVAGTWENAVVNADLEKIADYLLLLKNKNIPVLWRPLHEAAGNIYAWNGSAWFWWGNDGAEAYKNLWRYMFNYFKQKDLNNLIWVFTTQTDRRTNTSDLPFYPGSEYVDIVGRDSYGNGTEWVVTAAVSAAEFNTIQNNFPDKMVTLAEMGEVAQIGAQWNAGAHWLWFMPWYDFNATDETSPDDYKNMHADKTWWQAAVASEEVITREEIEINN
ncbi:MAG: Ig-like domain-containing protein [Prevotellaceae bacterium]|nr:Ig-like domain-containing protein [Prevotellaceae bacterium]